MNTIQKLYCCALAITAAHTPTGEIELLVVARMKKDQPRQLHVIEPDWHLRLVAHAHPKD